MRRRLVLAACCLLLSTPFGVGPAAAERASTALTSRWWRIQCDPSAPSVDAKPAACRMTVRLRGALDDGRLRLLREALRRRDAARRALGRDIRLQVDVDSPGGQVFAAMEIGRLLRSESASISVAQRASCISACIFVLMGAPERSIAKGARIGIHRPAIDEAGGDALVDAMSDQMVAYAEQMGASRTLVADMMTIPSNRMRLLTIGELDGYGIEVSIGR